MKTFKYFGIYVLAAGLTLGTATAQTDTSSSNAAGQNSNTTNSRTDERKGFDYGWLGLIGLAGLTGLRRRDTSDRLHTTTSRA